MSDRLTELQRQRALLQQHLTWIEREIATEAAQSGAPVPAPPPALPPAATDATGTAPAEADAILAQYRTETASLQSDVRKGCFLYFALAALLLVAAVAALYLYTRSRH